MDLPFHHRGTCSPGQLIMKFKSADYIPAFINLVKGPINNRQKQAKFKEGMPTFIEELLPKSLKNIENRQSPPMKFNLIISRKLDKRSLDTKAGHSSLLDSQDDYRGPSIKEINHSRIESKLESTLGSLLSGGPASGFPCVGMWAIDRLALSKDRKTLTIVCSLNSFYSNTSTTDERVRNNFKSLIPHIKMRINDSFRFKTMPRIELVDGTIYNSQ